MQPAHPRMRESTCSRNFSGRPLWPHCSCSAAGRCCGSSQACHPAREHFSERALFTWTHAAAEFVAPEGRRLCWGSGAEAARCRVRERSGNRAAPGGGACQRACSSVGAPQRCARTGQLPDAELASSSLSMCVPRSVKWRAQPPPLPPARPRRHALRWRRSAPSAWRDEHRRARARCSHSREGARGCETVTSNLEPGHVAACVSASKHVRGATRRKKKHARHTARGRASPSARG